jgi:hypothetical protein
MTKRFNLDFLNKICNEKNIELLQDYPDNELNSQKMIEFKCVACKEKTSKRFANIDKYNALCKNCSRYISKNRISYNINYLQNICKEKEIKLSKDYSNEPLNSTTFIEFTCIKCNELTSKKFVFIIRYDAVCHACSCFEQGNKAAKTTLLKYGVKNISQLNEIKNKKRETTIKNYGVHHNSQSQIIKNKKVETTFKNFGVRYPQQSQLVRNKSKQTCVNNYGVEHPTQNSEIAEQAFTNCYKPKHVMFPSGKEIKCQGYEPFALEELIKANTDENNIVTGCKNVPTIWYNDESGKQHRHYVDIFIPSQNKCIEVKSTWTIKNKNGNIFEKQKAAKEYGYNYEIWVYDSKGNKKETYL